MSLVHVALLGSCVSFCWLDGSNGSKWWLDGSNGSKLWFNGRDGSKRQLDGSKWRQQVTAEIYKYLASR
jgi:hypothetical protein